MKERNGGMKMLKTLEIENFKSIKHIKLDCRRINVFIGEPNTGKSNILESLGLLSWIGHGLNKKQLSEFVRYDNLANLFYDMDLTKNISIKENTESIYRLKFKDVEFRLYYNKTTLQILNYKGEIISKSEEDKNRRYLDLYIQSTKKTIKSKTAPYKYYKFRTRNLFPENDPFFLYPPDGENLLAILLTNKDLRTLIYEIFAKFGLKLVINPVEKKIEVQKEKEGIVISYPYSIISDTIQRIIFYITAIESNRDSILIFEEPEANAFPFYTKFLAERIALDESNQYFISTHNPYLLLSILEKAPEKDVQIFVTYFEDFQTKVKTLSDEQKSEILDLDASVFFNLQRFLEGF